MLAWDHALCRAVMRLFMRVVLGWLRRAARRRHGIAGGRSGAVVIVQRFGSALNLNVHGHALVLDGVFAEDGAGGLRFHPTPPATDDDIDEVLAAIARRVDRLLARRGVVEEDAAGGADPWSEEEPVLAGLSAASVQGRLALGPCPGAEVRRCGASPALAAAAVAAVSRRGPWHAHRDGFDLHAGLVVPARDRARLARTCRYALRPPVADERIRLTEGGQVWLELRHRWRDGTTHLLFDPIELLERLAALTPRPRINLVLYYGVLAAHAAWRSRLGTAGTGQGPSLARGQATIDSGGVAATPAAEPPRRAAPRRSNLHWAQLMARSFGYDVLACARCGGRMRLIALIEQRAVIDRILAHLGLPTDVPAARPSRAPPVPLNARSALADDDLPAA